MKGIFKNLVERAGYVVMTQKRLVKLEERLHAEHDFYRIIKRVLDVNANILCFDIGANVGQTTQKFKQYFPNSTVHAFEPIRETCQILIRNTSSLAGVTVHQLAMGASSGEKKVHLRKYSQLNSLTEEANIIAEGEGGVGETIQINSVDNFIKKNRISKIDILKSDTEGYELQVLQGARQALTHQVIDIVYIEVGFSRTDKQHVHWVDVVNFLEGFDYSFCGLFESQYDNEMKIHYANALFMSPKKLLANKKLFSPSTQFP